VSKIWTLDDTQLVHPSVGLVLGLVVSALFQALYGDGFHLVNVV